MGILTLLAQLTINPSEIGYQQSIGTGDAGLARILTLVYTWAGIVGVVVLIVASLLFITSRGDPSQMKRSKDAIRGTVIGLIVVMVAFAITRFVLGGLQG